MARYRAVAIILRKNDVLVMGRDKHGNKYYSFPGGGIEAGETPRQAVAREIIEETSLKVRVGPEIYRCHYDKDKIHYYFLCTYVAGTPKFVGDAAEIFANLAGNLHEPAWLPVQKLPEALLLPFEIRDWLVEDLKHGFPKKPRITKLKINDLRQSL